MIASAADASGGRSRTHSRPCCGPSGRSCGPACIRAMQVIGWRGMFGWFSCAHRVWQERAAAHAIPLIPVPVRLHRVQTSSTAWPPSQVDCSFPSSSSPCRCTPPGVGSSSTTAGLLARGAPGEHCTGLFGCPPSQTETVQWLARVGGGSRTRRLQLREQPPICSRSLLGRSARCSLLTRLRGTVGDILGRDRLTAQAQ
jgi:hypothetical protein